MDTLQEQATNYGTLKPEQMAPFLSLLLAEGENIVLDELYVRINKAVSIHYGLDDEHIVSCKQPDNLGDGQHARIFSFELRKPPSWASSKAIDLGLENSEYHVIVIFEFCNYLGIYCSSKDIRDYVRTEIIEKDDSVTPVPISRLFGCFVNDDDVRMLWLANTAGASRIKPGSKVIIGDGLADALDPLDDQFFAMSAVRTRTDFGGDNQTSIGLNPYKSMVWCAQCNSWETFTNRAFELLDRLNTSSDDNHAPISILAYPLNTLEGVSGPYEFLIFEADTLEDEETTQIAKLIRLLTSEYSFEFDTSPIRGEILLRVSHNGNFCGSISVKPKIGKYKVSFDIEEKPEKSFKGKLSQFCRVFNHPELIKIWFESGHTILNGMIFKTELRDMPFSRFLWSDFGETPSRLATLNSVTFKEKPTRDNGKGKAIYDVTQIGMQKSLFCWVSKNWHCNWDDEESFSKSVGGKPASGWLYCDDGPGENADFIHIDEYKGKQVLSFIHIKSLKKPKSAFSLRDRKLSVGAYDVVINQAIKNIRYCDRKNLVTAIEEKIENSKKRSVWCDGVRIEENGDVAFLEQVRKLTQSHVKRVVVIQPHTLRGVYEKTESSKIKMQLNTLLLSAQRAAASNNAEFYVVGTEWSDVDN